MKDMNVFVTATLASLAAGAFYLTYKTSSKPVDKGSLPILNEQVPALQTIRSLLPQVGYHPSHPASPASRDPNPWPRTSRVAGWR